jgi:biotin operon repressor
MSQIENKKIQHDIIQLLKANKECELGFIVSELDYSYNQILQNILELKNEGKIFKLVGHKGYFSLKKY